MAKAGQRRISKTAVGQEWVSRGQLLHLGGDTGHVFMVYEERVRRKGGAGNTGERVNPWSLRKGVEGIHQPLPATIERR